ncbi:XLF-domain-containing protein [Xylariaceae sp. FL1651]|nr:XLF-domain-containing protein [Xylariaceae sp. FL1651]
MESASKWCSLPHFPGLPALLISTHFTTSSYTLYITDLANLWMEKLDRKGILSRSIQEKTSIDLGESDDYPEQWAVFLSKLKAALDPTSSDHHLTSLTLAASRDSKSPDTLTLRITCELPTPLDALRWPIHLVKCPPASLASELVLPLIHAHYTQNRDTEDLMKRLKEKDAVITKLGDKLGAMGVSPDDVFNSLSAKRPSSRAAAEDKVKGLAPFIEDQWRSKRGTHSPQDAAALIRNVFGHAGFRCETDMDLGASDTLNDWWKRLGPRSYSGYKSEHVRADKAFSAEDDEDFQVQSTPPNRSSKSITENKSKDEKAGYETLESEGSEVSDSHQAQDKRHARLDTTIKPRQFCLPEMKAALAASPPVEADDETATVSDSSSDHSSRPLSPPSKSPNTPRKGALGRIGGKFKSTSSSPQTPKRSAPVAASDGSASSSSKKLETRKIGAIGKNSRRAPKRLRAGTPAEPEESEADEQKAERKRTELAKELERKSIVPVKKKRKF